MKEQRNVTKTFKRIQGLFLAVVIAVSLFPAMHSEAATSSQKALFKQELIQMLNSADETSHNVYKYRLTGSEVTNTFNELKQSGDTKWLIAAYYSNLYVDYTISGKYVKEISLENVDADALNRYKRLEANVQKIKAGIEPGMSDLDKVMYLHDSIVELTSYQMVAYQSYGAGGVLGDKKGVCAGYTKALNLLLADQNILATYMRGPAINHGWTSVYLDGQWYHIDSTWDDTRSSKSGLTSRQFLLRNDSEFVTNDKNSHVAWEVFDYNQKYTSTSTRFTNWYVHDIVGKMAYENGYWYYVDTKTNSIMQNTAIGGSAKVMLDGTGKSTITLVDATSAGITYKQDGVTKTVGYEGVKEQVKETVTEKASAAAQKTEGQPVIVNLYMNGKYCKVGEGLLKEAKCAATVEDTLANILELPNLDKWVGEDQYVEFVGITKTADGSRWFLKGHIKNK